MRSSDSCVIGFIKLSSRKGGQWKARKVPGLAMAFRPDGVYVAPAAGRSCRTRQ